MIIFTVKELSLALGTATATFDGALTSATEFVRFHRLWRPLPRLL